MDRPRLQTLVVELTQDCDHSCRHCYNYWTHPGWRSAPPPVDGNVLPLLAHVLDQIDCSHVTLTGGEPLLRADLVDIVRALAERDLRVNLITNGHRLAESLLGGLVGAGVSLFELPLLSYRREVHDVLSGSQGAFDAVLEALARIRLHRARAVAAFVATRLNIRDLPEALKLARAFGANAVMLNRFNPGGRGAAHLDELLPTVDEMRWALEVANDAVRKLGLPVSCSIPIQPCLIDVRAYPNLSAGYCAAGTSRAYYTLDTAGNVRPCNHSPTVLGNVWEEPFGEIVHSSCLARFKAARPAFCKPCAVREECQGGCKASAEVCYGDLCAEEPFLRRGPKWARLLPSTNSSRLHE